MTSPDAANTYLRNKVMTASREELRLLLLDGSIKFANQARAGLESGDNELAFAGFSQCRAIVVELLSTIRPEHNPELAENVKSVFTFMFGQLIEASAERDIAKLDTVIELLEYERETWAMLMDQIARGTPATHAEAAQPSGPPPAHTPSAHTPSAHAPSAAPIGSTLSVQG